MIKGSSSSSYTLPRKVSVGTCIFPHYGPWLGLDKRLEELTIVMDHFVTKIAQEKKSLDIIFLSEHAISGGVRTDEDKEKAGSGAAAKAISFDGKVHDFFKDYSKKLQCYICIPMHEERVGKIYNSVILINRNGERIGTYDKCLPVVDNTWNDLESGITPAQELPIFNCDFGKLGLQICWDMEHDRAWQEMADKGVELVGWLTASPATIKPRLRAMQHGYWIVSSCMRNNATIYQPHTGFIHAQTKSITDVLIEEIDLSTLHLYWMPGLNNGKVFTDTFAEDVDYHYDEVEDNGLFWSQNPKKSIQEMAAEIGLLDKSKRLERSHELNPYW